MTKNNYTAFIGAALSESGISLTRLCNYFCLSAYSASPYLVTAFYSRLFPDRSIEYLVDRYGDGRLAPPIGTPERVRYLYWLHYAEGSAMPPLLLRLVFDRIETSPMPFFARPIARSIVSRVKESFIMPQLVQHFDYLEAELEQNLWFVGSEFTAADIQMSFPLEAATVRAGLDSSRPKLMSFLDRIHARPAYQRAIERGGHMTF